MFFIIYSKINEIMAHSSITIIQTQQNLFHSIDIASRH